MTAFPACRFEIQDIQDHVIVSRPYQMYGWPGLTRTSGGDLLLAASERRFHCCPFGREVIVRSHDGGRSWSLPREIYSSELDDRDSNLLTMPDGTVVLSWFTSAEFERGWPDRGRRITPVMREELLGSWMLTSHDGGVTWDSRPRRMPVGYHISPSVLSDSSLLTCGVSDGAYRVFRSVDAGEHWKELGIIPTPANEAGAPIVNESHLLEVEPGHIVGMFRATSADIGPLYQSDSFDGGQHWTLARRLPVWGAPPHLLKLQNGLLLCSFGHRQSPYSIRLMVSRDLGRTWDTDQIQTLYQWRNAPDMGYPTTIELDDHQLLTVFYCSWRDKAPMCKEAEGILGVRYRLAMTQ